MKKKHLFALCSFVALSACGGGSVTKKVLVIGRGGITATESDITMKDGSGYADKTVEVMGDKAVAYNVTSPAGKTTINVPAENGFYILNLRKDTIVGSQQNLGTDLGGRTVSQEELKVKIDSLIKLTTGSNVSGAAHNYMILPNQLVKVSSNTEAKVFGPFTKIPGTLEADKDGKAPEVYKFYTNTEMRELIANLKKQTI